MQIINLMKYYKNKNAFSFLFNVFYAKKVDNVIKSYHNSIAQSHASSIKNRLFRFCYGYCRSLLQTHLPSLEKNEEARSD